MTSISLSAGYDVVWQLKTKPHIKISRCRKVINTHTNRVLKRTLKGSSIGYWISSKEFILEENINSMVEKIPKNTCPF